MGSKLDCIIIGYNELPFDQYESFLRKLPELEGGRSRRT